MSQDLGRHIKLGEIIFSTWQIPAVNLFSYTMSGSSFVNHHWFPELIFYLLSSVGGVEAILLWKAAFVLLASVVVFFLGLRLGTFFWAIILSFPYLFIWSYRFDSRPEVFSFLLLSLYLLFIYLFSVRHSWKYLFVLFPLQILWVNSHIYFFVGLFVYGAFVLSEYALRRGDRRLLGVGVLLFLCVLVTPHGIEGAIVPLTIFSNYGYTIVENQNIIFLNSWFFIPQVFVFEFLSALLLVFCMLTFTRKYLFWYIVMVFGVVASYVMVRNLPLFVILSFPCACFTLVFLEKRYIRSFFALRTFIVAFVVVIACVHVIRGVQSPTFGFFYIEPGRGAVDFIEENSLEGPIFNNFDIGSYLIYRLYPREPVFVDGRPEAYTTAFFEEYRQIQEEPDFFEEKSLEYAFEMVVFSKTDITPWAQTFLQNLSQNRQWDLVYSDTYFVIFVPRGSENFLKIKS